MRILNAPAKVRTAVLLTHSDPAGIAVATALAAQVAQRAGAELVATSEELGKHDVASGVRTVKAFPTEPDLCLVLGGDGTILRGLRMFAGGDVPVFGINFGTVGFLAAAERSELAESLERAFAGEFDVMELPALELGQAGSGKLGLNDIAFLRQPHRRVAELSYLVGGQEVGDVRCDGLVAATPAGSTWGVEGYALSFVAPHTFTARPLVVAPDDVLSVRNAGRDSVDIAIDGRPAGELEPGAEAEVRFRDGVGRLAQLPGSSFYRRVREKFGRLAR